LTTRIPGGSKQGESERGGGRPLPDARPKYRVLQDRIRAGIADGSLTDGARKLPSEQDMARSFGVAYMTVRAAVNGLVAEGVLQRLHGKGTFVRTDPPVRSTAVGVLALVVPSLNSLWNVAGLYYFPSIVQGFCAEATRLGYEPTVIGRTRDALTSATGELADVTGAACLLISRDDAQSLEALRDAQRVPVVGINHYHGRRAVSYVAVDQAGGMEDAVHSLVARGHRRIAFLPGPEGNLGAEERRAGFVRAAARRGIDGEVVEDGPADYTDLSGVVRTRALLARPARRRPTAVATAGDLIAAGVLQATREAGLSVPDDLSVVGYGDFQVATFLTPTLTTVRLPLADLGARAAALLHERLQGATGRRAETLRPTLIERDSVGAASERLG
jgi:DNA-binding LacI/PurR family transcriptional regulator